MTRTVRPQVTVPIPASLRGVRPRGLRWGTVSTARGSCDEITRFAAYHLDLGAAEITLFLDEPDPKTEAALSRHPAVRVVRCDPAYWADKPTKARRSHRLRQAHNATLCYRRTTLDWLAHIDIDEFLILPRPVHDVLADLPDDVAGLRLRPAEMLAMSDPWNGPAHFKLSRSHAGHDKTAVRQINAEFGAYLSDVVFSYSGVKTIARTGLPDIRVGVHQLVQQGAQVANTHLMPDGHVGHAHAPSWETFARNLPFRMSDGSYRKTDPERMQLWDVLDLVRRSEGMQGLRRFYDGLNGATPEVLAALRAHDMLMSWDLDIDRKVARHFGALARPTVGGEA